MYALYHCNLFFPCPFFSYIIFLGCRTSLIKYDAIYFCGGDTSYLLKRINETGFNEILKNYIKNGGIYIGVSAGSIIMANNLQDNLGYLNCKLDVHGNEGIKIGKFDPKDYSYIKLPDNKAIIIKNNEYEVIE